MDESSPPLPPATELQFVCGVFGGTSDDTAPPYGQ
jgi:hypothetical protein